MSSFEAALREPYLSLEEEREAIRAWQESGDRNALGRLLRSHARQAWSQARRWTSNVAEIEDLVAEGMIALIEAANKFDLKRDVRFGTYANWFVKNRVYTALMKVKTVIDVPTRAYFDARAGRLSPERSIELVGAVDNVLNVQATPAEDTEITAVLTCPNLNPEEFLTEQSSKEQVAELLEVALSRLNPIEQSVIRRKLDEDAADETSAAATLKVTRAQMRSIERRAMHRLRRMLQESGFQLAMLEH